MTIVIPTLGLAEREALLWRAIDSARTQRGVRVRPLVVLNGGRWAPAIERSLAAAPDISVIVCERASLPDALRAGRDAVATSHFGTLDDDDTLLPDALATRLASLLAAPDADVVVTNGLVRHADRETLHLPPDADVSSDFLRALQRRNWLLPGSWLARSDRVTCSLYDGMPRYRECTFLAVRFAIEYRAIWLPEPTVAYHVGSPAAETRSREYLEGQVEATRALLTLPLPAWFRRHVEREVAAAYHLQADHAWQRGRLTEAWRLHYASLRARGGVRFLPFTRHLLAASMRQLVVHEEYET